MSYDDAATLDAVRLVEVARLTEQLRAAWFERDEARRLAYAQLTQLESDKASLRDERDRARTTAVDLEQQLAEATGLLKDAFERRLDEGLNRGRVDRAAWDRWDSEAERCLRLALWGQKPGEGR